MPIASHYVPQAEREEAQEEDEELYADEACLIKVQQSPGFLCHIEASARFSVPPKTLWEQAIVHPGDPFAHTHEIVNLPSGIFLCFSATPPS